jgi:ACS family glucarate transporter-like MFS transporter
MLYRYRVLSLLFVLSIITYLDRVCISVAGPRMQKELGLSPEMWGWVVGAFTLSYAAFEIPSGVLGDRIGPRKVLTRIVLWWSVFTSLTGAVSSFAILLATRFFFGAGEAGAYPNIASSISRWFPAQERARAAGISWMASRLGGAISPLIVVPIQQIYGWRVSFYVFGILGVIWAAVWYWYYRDHPSEKEGVTQAELEEIGATRRAPAVHSLPWKEVLKTRNFRTLLLMYHTYCWGSYFYLSWLHTYLQKGRGFTENEMKIWSTLPFIIGACGNLCGGLLSDYLSRKYGLKFGRRIVGSVGLGVSGLLMMTAALTPVSMVAAIALALGYGAMDCMLPVSWAVCLDIGRKHAGAVSGAMNMAGQLGSFLSSVAFGYMVKYFGNYNQPLIPFAAMLVVSAYLFWQIDPTEQLVKETEHAPAPEPVHV